MKNSIQIRRLSSSAVILFSFIILTLPFGKAFSQCYSPPGDTAVYGDHEWNVYAFNTGLLFNNGQPWVDAYSGYYTSPGLDFDTQVMWPDWASPAFAPGYNGCAVDIDDHSWSAKRRGFDCGAYQIDIVSHDDDGQLFVNGVKVWEHAGCCDEHINVWNGFLYDTSTVIFRVAEGYGGSLGAIRFVQRNAILPLGPTTICPGYTLSLDGGPGNSYEWSTGETTRIIDVTAAGNYSRTVYLNGCNNTDSVQIHIAPIDTPELIIASLDFCPLTEITVLINNYDSLRLYSINPFNGYFDGSNAVIGVPGDYIITAYDALGCSASAPSFTIAPPPGENDYGHNVWHVNAYSYGEDADYGSSWKSIYYAGYYIDSNLNFDSQTQWSDTSNPSSAMSYQGCPVPDDQISWSAKRQGFPCGIYQIDVLGHDDEGQLFVDGVNVWDELGARSYPFVNAWTGFLSSASQVEFRVTEGFGASNGRLLFNLQGQPSSTITVSGNEFVCTGQSYTLTTAQASGYLWSNGETSDTVHASQSGDYSCISVDSNGCSYASDTVSITILPDAAPVAHINATSNTICNWNDVTLSSDNSDGNTWSTNEATQSINVAAEGNYTLTVTNSAGCIDQTSVTIGRSLTPPVPIAKSPVLICENASADLIASGLAPGGFVGSFNVYEQQYVEVTQDIPEYNFTIEMWVKTTAADAGIFCARNEAYGVTEDRRLYLQNGQLYVYAFPSLDEVNTGFTINDGKWHHIALTVQTGSGKIVYVDGVSSGIIDTFDHSDFYWQNSFRIGYARDIHIQNDHYFDGQIDNVRIWSEVRSQADIRENMMLETPTSSTNLVYEAQMNGEPNNTFGNNAVVPHGLSLIDPDFYTYTWTGTGAPAPSTSETQTTSPLSSGGDYTVTASAGSCSPSQSSSASVIIASPVDYYIDDDGDGYGSWGPISSCSNPGAYYVTNNADCNDVNGNINPGVTEICNNGIDDNCNGQWDENCNLYTYYIDGDGDTYGDPADAIGSPSTTPPVGYVSNSSDCSDVNAAVHPGATDVCNSIDDNCDGVVDENAIQATLTPDGSVNVCKGTPLTLSANTGSGIAYLWFKNGRLISGASGSSYAITKSGSYSVYELNFVCSSLSATTGVTVNVLPSATITHSGSLDICGAGSVLLTANAGTGLHYQWKKGINNISGATNQNYTAASKGTYKVEVTNNKGCSKISTGVKVTKSCKSDFSEDEFITATLNIYPNPSNGQFVIEMDLGTEGDEQAEIQIFNSLGQQVYSDRTEVVSGSLHEEINTLSKLPAGNYFVRVIVNEEVFAEKIIIQ